MPHGLTNRFDYFPGFPTQPKPLEILIELATPDQASRVAVYETAVGKRDEIYDLRVSADGKV